MTGVNLCILVCFIVCVFRISDMNREINAVGNEFEYIEVKENEVSLKLENNKTVMMKFVKDGMQNQPSKTGSRPCCLLCQSNNGCT